uniref:Uncharacterized protein n=1 Tax=Graphocephala atropunctata TaxID=36148 RepID=A0A1B6LM06_9HEMI
MSVFHKYKDMFTTNRSSSMPAPIVEKEEVDAREPEEPRKILRRSKSGRVKAKTRTRSMVSTFDFNITEQERFEQDPKDVKAERFDPESMKRRIEKTWPGLLEEGDRQNNSDGRFEVK